MNYDGEPLGIEKPSEAKDGDFACIPLGEAHTVGEFRKMLEGYSDDSKFGFRNQPMQSLFEVRYGESTYLLFQPTEDFAPIFARWALANPDLIPWKVIQLDKPSPRIVCLCGSTRFWREFQEASLRETLAGNIVLSIGAARCADDDDKSFGGYIPVDEFDEKKKELDELHFRKIDLADEVLVLNVGGYIGESTANEIRYAESIGKMVRYLHREESHA